MPLPKKKRRRNAAGRRRSNKGPSQKVLDQRVREIWVDGYGLLPSVDGNHIESLRLALRKLVRDDAYWNGLKRLAQLKRMSSDLMNDIKSSKFQLPE